MIKFKLKVGDTVQCVSNYCSDKPCKNRIGKIIEIDKYNYYIVKFFKPVEHGYDGEGKEKLRPCTYFMTEEIALYKKPILKIFLKEKQNEL